MARAHETSRKKEVQQKKDKKVKEKAKKKLEKKENKGTKSLDDMIAYVDEFGNITSTPVDLSKREKINVEDIQVQVPRQDESREDQKLRLGVVSFYNDSKGFGFIRELNTKDDLFFHVNGVLEPVKENDKVTYEVIRTPKGPNAVNVKIYKEPKQ
jgi:cold shock CspA family protein